MLLLNNERIAVAETLFHPTDIGASVHARGAPCALPSLTRRWPCGRDTARRYPPRRGGGVQCRRRRVRAPPGTAGRLVRRHRAAAWFPGATVRAATLPQPLLPPHSPPVPATAGPRTCGRCCPSNLPSTRRRRKRTWCSPPAGWVAAAPCPDPVRANWCVCVAPAGRRLRHGEGARCWRRALLPRRRSGSAGRRGRRRAQIACWSGVGPAPWGSGPRSQPPQWTRKRRKKRHSCRGEGIGDSGHWAMETVGVASCAAVQSGGAGRAA